MIVKSYNKNAINYLMLNFIFEVLQVECIDNFAIAV